MKHRIAGVEVDTTSISANNETADDFELALRGEVAYATCAEYLKKSLNIVLDGPEHPFFDALLDLWMTAFDAGFEAWPRITELALQKARNEL